MSFAAALPWTDKKGRPHLLRSVIFLLLLVPGTVLGVRWGVWGLGTRPLKAAIHSTGYWAVWLLLGSLLISPLKALTGNTQWPVVRRMVGVAALAYALIHLSLYMADEDWKLLHIGAEILSRFYLTIGAVALLGLIVLGATSTDSLVRSLGARWKQLHRLVYGIAVLTAVHYTLQSKADVSQALVAAGAFAWLMLWRRLPAGRDRTVVPMVGLAVASALVTLATEFLWYRFGTKIDPWRAMAIEADVQYGLHPAALVLALGLLAATAIGLRQLAATRAGQSVWFTVAIYAAGAFAADLGMFLFGLSPDDPPAGQLVRHVAAVLVFAALGYARTRLQGAGQRSLLDVLWAASALFPLLALVFDDPRLPVAAAVVVAAGALVTCTRVWTISRTAAVLLLPLVAWIAYAATATVA